MAATHRPCRLAELLRRMRTIPMISPISGTRTAVMYPLTIRRVGRRLTEADGDRPIALSVAAIASLPWICSITTAR